MFSLKKTFGLEEWRSRLIVQLIEFEYVVDNEEIKSLSAL